jgi:hypothetical protein
MDAAADRGDGPRGHTGEEDEEAARLRRSCVVRWHGLPPDDRRLRKKLTSGVHMSVRGENKQNTSAYKYGLTVGPDGRKT